MDKTIIIGGGFSALSCQILLKNKPLIITPISRELNIKKLLRRKKIEVNKLFATKAFSYGSLKINLFKTKFHDRLDIGGNSNIWGGLIKANLIPNYVLDKFKKRGINFTKISYATTGSISNSEDVYQISDKNRILNSKNRFSTITDGYLSTISVRNKGIKLEVLLLKNKIYKKIYCKKIILAIGAIQLLDLLYRSKLLKNNDKITLEEFSYRLRFRILFFSKLFKNKDKEGTVIRYKLSSAISHFFGIQKKLTFAFILDWIPIYFEQSFENNKKGCLLVLKDGILTEKIKKNSENYLFGRSIHYCNMKINGININKILSSINKNIFGVGMAFVNQDLPGPISNDIIQDIIKNNKCDTKIYGN